MKMRTPNVRVTLYHTRQRSNTNVYQNNAFDIRWWWMMTHTKAEQLFVVPKVNRAYSLHTLYTIAKRWLETRSINDN